MSSSAFEGFWTSLRDEFIDGFTADSADTALKKPMWKQPDLELELLVSNQQLSSAKGASEDEKEKPSSFLWSLKLKKKEGKNFILLSDRDYIFELSQNSWDLLFNADFRDHQAPFAFSLRQMNQVRVKAFDFDYLIEKQTPPPSTSKDEPKEREKRRMVVCLESESRRLSTQ